MTAPRAYTIFLPCDVLEVHWLEAAASQLTPVECFVLEAIHAGAGGFHELAHLFQLGQRPMLDLLLDLWNRSYVQIDAQTGQLSLPGDIARRVDDDERRREGRVIEADSGGLAALAGVRRPKTMKLLMERISGHVLPAVPLLERPVGVRVAPSLLPFAAPCAASSMQLVNAVRDELRRKVGRASSSRVAEAYLTGSPVSDIAPRRESRLVQVDLHVRTGADDELVLEVRPVWYLRSAVRRDIAARLQLHAEAAPELPFFKQMRDVAAQLDHRDVGEVDHRLAALQLAVQRSATPSGKVQTVQQLVDHHEAMALASEDIRELVVQRWQGPDRVSLVAAADDGWLAAAIGRAQHQIVIATPAPRYVELAKVLRSLDDALARGIQLVILWGAHGDDALDGAVRTALAELAFRHGGRVVHDEISARSNARFVVIDDRELLLGTRDLLGATAGRRSDAFSPALWLQASRRVDRAGAIGDVLRWARLHMPSFAAGQRIALPATSADAELADPELPGEPELPAAVDADRPASDTGEASSSQRPVPPQASELWRADWASHVEVLADLVRRCPPGTDLIEDGSHRTWIWRVLESARRWFVLASPRLERDVVDADFLRRLADRLGAARELVVVLFTARIRDRALALTLDGLARQWQGRCIVHVGGCDGAALASEQFAVISSFGFLATEGYQMAARRRRHSELGLVSRDPLLVARVLDELGKHVPALRAMRSAAAPIAPPPRPTSRPAWPVSNHLQALVHGLGEATTPSARQAAVDRWIDLAAGARDPWPDVARLVALGPGLPRAAIQHAVAALLSARWAERDEQHHIGWRAWLTAEQWHAGQFQPAWLLRSSLAAAISDDPVGRRIPGVGLSRLAASIRLAERFDTELQRGIDPGASAHDERLALGLLSVHGVLVDASPAAARLLTRHRADLGAPWSALAGASLAYWDASAQAVPWQTVRERTSREATEERVAAAGAHLVAELAHARSTGFAFKLGQGAWDHLFRADSELDRLRHAADAGDRRAASDVIGELRARRLDAERLLDDAVAAVVPRVAPGHGGKVLGPKRRICIERLAGVLEAANAWIAAGEALRGRDANTGLRDGVRALAAALRPLRGELGSLHTAATEQRALHAPVLGRLIETLAPLLSLTET